MKAWLRIVLAGAALISTGTACSQPTDIELPRRASLGILLAIDSAGAVVASAVPDGTAAAEAGMRAGDVIKALDGMPDFIGS
jgi:S1-C subfamily serine protease